MLFLFALGCLAAATLGSVVMYQRTAGRLPEARGPGALPPKSSDTPSAPPALTTGSDDPTLETLAVGDIVVDGSDHWVVIGCVRYREERNQWSLFVLEDGRARRFLEVRKLSGSAEGTWLDDASDVPTFGQLGQGLTYRGQPYTLAGRGDARTTVEGDTGTLGAGLVRYARYHGPGGEVLVLEEEGAARRPRVGHRVAPTSLSFMSGELVRAHG